MKEETGMYEPAVSLARVFCPWVQAFFTYGVLLLTGFLLGSIAFCGEHRLLRMSSRVLWKLPFLGLVSVIVYGILRFSGVLLYPTDGWDQWGMWNATNQNRGMMVLFFGVPLLIGTTLAVCRKNLRQGNEQGES